MSMQRLPSVMNPATAAAKYRIFAIGDSNAFFGLMLDNMSKLVIMAAIRMFLQETC